MAERPLILVTNDDGVRAPGIVALAEEMAALGEVMVVAPDREQSAMSHSISLHRPLRADELRPGWIAVDGTPVDCVYLALHHFLPRRPSLVVSGINAGYNLGTDVFYSGTVAAAVEAAIRKLPAIAVSRERGYGDDYGPAARFARVLGERTLAEGLPPGVILNVNVPAAKGPSGYSWACLGERLYHDKVDRRADPRGRSYFWIGGPEVGFGDIPGSDCLAVRDGIVSITPLKLDFTHDELLGQLPGWNLGGFDAIR
jgi:5'-nucleotidase